MTQRRIAYMPLVTYPEAIADAAILAAAGFAVSVGCTLSVTTFAVDIPPMSSPLAGLLIDIPGLINSAEAKSKAECERLHSLVNGAVASPLGATTTTRTVVIGSALDTAAEQARYFDLTLLPWSDGSVASQEMAQAIVFGSGRPTVLIPPSANPGTLNHLAIAWDASRVAARALGDALPLLGEGGRVSVLTVQDEKPLSGKGLAGTLASSLEKRGFNANPIEITLGKRSIAEALQDTALSEGAQVLALGGFGHSRVRDFFLGGATKGILSQLRLPTLLSH
jgi:nucleotide-binding universal stress UspA family protein